MEIVISIAAKIAEYTVEPIGQQLYDLFCYKSKVAELEEQVGELRDERSKVQHSIDTARRNGEEIEDDVKKWLGRVDEISAEAKELFEAKTSYLNLSSRYQLCRKAKKIAQDVKIQKERKFDTVSYLSPLQGISSTKGYKAFESRELIFKKIMEALTDANTNRIGVYGMGGAGKTMLVKEVAAKAMEKKVFDEVVMATVSQTPNIKEIQGVIADKLGLTFTEETIEGRADRLRERLMTEMKMMTEKKMTTEMKMMTEKKILVIIDDIWEKFDLEVVGISFGDDQKGCKFLFTSRSEDVLRNDMDTQKVFNLGVLLNDEARHLFGKIVGGLPEDTADFHFVVDEVVKECAGLPIAITIVANALKNRSLHVWKDVVQQLRRSNPTNIKGMQEKVYSSIELSYNFFKSEEAKSLFLLCSLYKEDYNIDVESLLRYGMGLDLLQDVYNLEEVRNRVDTLVENLKSSCLLLNGDGDNTVKIHDVICDVARHIAAKDKHMLNIGNVVHLQEWSKNKKLKDSTAISLPYTDVYELPERLECPQLMLFLLFNKNRSLQIPHPFFEGMGKLRALNLTGMLCPHLPSSLSFLQNLQTLCLDDCELEDVAIIGEVKNLKVLSLKNSNIKQLPKQIGQLTHLQLLDLSNCKNLEIIPANVLSNLKKLEELYMKDSFNGWEGEGQSSEGSNARLTELDHLSHLTTLEIDIPSAKIMSKALIFEKLVRYKISIGNRWRLNCLFVKSRTLQLKLDISFQSVDGIKILLKSCEDLCLDELKGIQNILYELNSDGFPRLKYLSIRNNVEIQCIINSMELTCIAFPALELFYLIDVINLEKICHGQLAMGSFSNLRKVYVKRCDNLKFVFSSSMAGCFSQLQQMKINDCKVMGAIVAVERRDEIEMSDGAMDIMEFTQLTSLTLKGLPKLICFRSDDDSLFNEKVALPNLENLKIHSMDNLTMICHNQLVPNDFFCKLKVLKVESCGSLKSLFPASVAKHLIQLEELEILLCKALEDIVAKEEGLETEPNKFVFPRLTSLRLFNLPELKSFYPAKHTLEWPSLKGLNIFNCNKLKMFALDSTLSLVNCTSLQPLFWIKKDTFANLETLEILEWNDAMSETWHGQFPAEFFRKLKRLALHFSNSESATFSPSFVQELYRLEILDLRGDLIEEICPYKGRFPVSLRKFWLDSMPKLLQLWKEDSQTGKAFQNLEELQVWSCGRLKNLEPFPISLQNLKTLVVQDCDGLINLVTFSTAKTLVQLRDMKISNCKNITEIVANEGGEAGDPETVFGQLKSLKLEYLPRLTSFHLGNCTVKFPSLNEVTVRDCPKLKIFSQEVLSTPTLSTLEIEGHTHSFNPKKDDLNISIIQYWESRADQKVELLNVENMDIFSVDNLRMIWHNQLVLYDSFFKIKELTVKFCGSLKSLFPASVARHLVQLEKLEISDCKALEDIVIKEEGLEIEPNEFVFPRLISLQLDNLPELKSFNPTNHALEWPFLKLVRIIRCNVVKMFASDSTSLLDITVQQSLFRIKKVALPNLENLEIDSVDNLTMLCHNQLISNDFFCKLKVLMVNSCDSLKSLFPISVAKHLIQLEKLEIYDCKALEDIVIKEEGLEIEPNKFVFPRLTSLDLYNLPELKSFYPAKHTLERSSLKVLLVGRCNKLKMVASDSTISLMNITTLQPLFWIKMDIFANLEKLGTLEWNDAMNETWHRQFPAEFFHKLKHLGLYFSYSESAVFSASFVQELYNLERLNLRGDLIEEISPYKGRFPISLRQLGLYNMPKLMHLWKEDSQVGKAFQNLEELYVGSCSGLRNFEPFPISLQNLKILAVEECDELINLVTSSTAKTLVQLWDMTISKCKKIAEIVASEGGEAGDPEIVFSQLMFLTLEDLPRLTSFHPGNCTMKFPSLNKVIVKDCPELKIFSQGVLSMPTLSTLEIEGHTHSFNPEKDDLNISIKQYCESHANQKVDTSKEEDEEHNMDNDLKLEDTEEQAKNNTRNYEEHDKDDDLELEESKEQVENNTSNC